MYNFSPQNTYELTGNHDRWACATATVALNGGYTGKTFNATLKLTGTRDWSNTFEETDEFLAELVAEDDQINPFDLPGSKSDEIIRGNKKLNAAISNLPDLSYNFTYKRFSLSLCSELKLARHEIESTVQVDTVFDLKIKTVGKCKF